MCINYKPIGDRLLLSFNVFLLRLRTSFLLSFVFFKLTTCCPLRKYHSRIVYIERMKAGDLVSVSQCVDRHCARYRHDDMLSEKLAHTQILKNTQLHWMDAIRITTIKHFQSIHLPYFDLCGKLVQRKRKVRISPDAAALVVVPTLEERMRSVELNNPNWIIISLPIHEQATSPLPNLDRPFAQQLLQLSSSLRKLAVGLRHLPTATMIPSRLTLVIYMSRTEQSL